MELQELPFLTSEEVAGTTGFKRPSKQYEWLIQNGFVAKRKADGSILVSRQHFEHVMGSIEKYYRQFAPEPRYDEI